MPLLRRICTIFTLLCFAVLGVSAPANAAFIGTETYLAVSDRAERIGSIQAALARDDVRTQLMALGVDPERAAERVSSLTDQELMTVSQHLDELPAGGNLLAVIGVVFVVLLILEITGVIDIFKKV